MTYQSSSLFPYRQFLLRTRIKVFRLADLRYRAVVARVGGFDGAQDRGQVAVAAPGVGGAFVVDGVAEGFGAGCVWGVRLSQ
jgi:hypothetical protein